VSWYQIEYTGNGTYRIWIKAWHPGAWLEAYRAVRAAGGGVLESLYYAAVFIAHTALRKR
jgi:hypothetical protein